MTPRRYVAIARLLSPMTAVVLVCCTLACQSPRPLAVTGHQRTMPIEHRPGTNIVAIDVGLTGISHGDIQVADQWLDWTDDGRLKIFVEFENRTTGDLRVQIQTHFKDENDRFLTDQTPYKTIVIPRNQTMLYEATALKKEAARAHVRVRYARPS